MSAAYFMNGVEFFVLVCFSKAADINTAATAGTDHCMSLTL